MNGLQNFSPCTQKAAPGAGKLEYIPLDEIDLAMYHRAVNDAYNQQRSAWGGTWYSLPYLPETGRMSEDQRDNVQGETFDLNVSCSFAGDSAAAREEIGEMTRRRFLVRLTKGSVVLLLGTPEIPMRFSSKFDTGVQGTDNREHKFTFTGVSLFKLPGYIPIF